MTAYKQSADSSGAESASVGSFPVEVQEMLILQDLLAVLIGIDGKYLRIKVTSAEPGLAIRPDPTLDLSLADLVDRVLPLTHFYVRIVRFIDLRQNYEFGLINHALCAAVRELLREYLILVAQLEHQLSLSQLSLQKLWFFVQPAMQTLRALHSLVLDIESDSSGKGDRGTTLRGGMLLNVLHAHAVAAGGEQHTTKLLSFILQESAAPYLGMLHTWIHQGIVQDPYGEFMIEERPNRPYYDDSYWEKRYVKRDKHVASFLADKDLVDKILNTGKYLTVLRECCDTKPRAPLPPPDGDGSTAPVAEAPSVRRAPPAPAALTYSSNARVYAQLVEEAYASSSQRVLELLVDEKQLMQRLRSIKRFFLLEQGDWLVHFLDLAHEELSKDAGHASKSRLDSMLALALITAAPSDQERENMTCNLLQSTALDEVLYVISIDGSDRAAKGRQQLSSSTTSLSSTAGGAALGGLTGHDVFTLAYKVEWPVNIVFSRKTMTKYRWLFRHLFLYKLAERDLCSAWGAHQQTAALKKHPALALDFALRARMLHFVQSLQHYLVMDVIENCWHAFQESIRSVKTVEDVLRIHDKFLDTCIKLFVLNDPNLLKMLTRAINTSRNFAKYIETKTALFLFGNSSPDGTTREGDLGEEYAGVPTIRAKRLARQQLSALAVALSAEPKVAVACGGRAGGGGTEGACVGVGGYGQEKVEAGWWWCFARCRWEWLALRSG